jgi:hypothetical protein
MGDKLRCAHFSLLHTALYDVKLHEFFSVSERTTRRWQADGADLTNATRLLCFLRNLARPSASVERRLEDPDCERKLASLLNADASEDSFEDMVRDIAGDPDFEPFFNLPDPEEGDGDDASLGSFEARLMAELRHSLTGFSILVRMLEHGDKPDPEFLDRVFEGDARTVLANGGERITDRDLFAVMVAAERLMQAQIHRFNEVAKKMLKKVA